MWLYWCLLSTIISGFTAIALKKCSNNEPKRIALMGLLSYHLIMIAVSIITNPGFITKLNIADMINILPGILMQSIGFYCMISATKYGKVAITSSISKMNEKKRLSKILVSTIIIFLITSVVAVLFGFATTAAVDLVNPKDTNAIKEVFDNSIDEGVELNILERTVSVLSTDSFINLLSTNNHFEYSMFSNPTREY